MEDEQEYISPYGTCVVNRKINGSGIAFDVYIGRGAGVFGMWGNPFVVGKDGTREECVAKYERWIMEPAQGRLRNRLYQLRGKRLGCYCAPLPCHGDVLMRLADGPLGEPPEGGVLRREQIWKKDRGGDGEGD
jgi:hypothetical protein